MSAVPQEVNIEAATALVNQLVGQANGRNFDGTTAALVAVAPSILSIAIDMRRIADALEKAAR